MISSQVKEAAEDLETLSKSLHALNGCGDMYVLAGHIDQITDQILYTLQLLRSARNDILEEVP